MTHAAAKPGEDLKDSAVAVKDAVVDLAGEARRYATHKANLAKESASDMLESMSDIFAFLSSQPSTQARLFGRSTLLIGYTAILVCSCVLNTAGRY